MSSAARAWVVCLSFRVGLCFALFYRYDNTYIVLVSVICVSLFSVCVLLLDGLRAASLVFFFFLPPVKAGTLYILPSLHFYHFLVITLYFVLSFLLLWEWGRGS